MVWGNLKGGLQKSKGDDDGTNSTIRLSDSDLSSAFRYMRDPGVSLSITGHHLRDEVTHRTVSIL